MMASFTGRRYQDRPALSLSSLDLARDDPGALEGSKERLPARHRRRTRRRVDRSLRVGALPGPVMSGLVVVHPWAGPQDLPVRDQIRRHDGPCAAAVAGAAGRRARPALLPVPSAAVPAPLAVRTVARRMSPASVRMTVTMEPATKGVEAPPTPSRARAPRVRRRTACSRRTAC